MTNRMLLPFLFSICAFANELPSTFCSESQEITLKGQTCVQNGIAEPYFTVDFIYWKAREDGLQYLMTGVNGSKGKIYEPDFEGHPGFKAGLGLNLGHDGWDVYIQYTWLYADATDRFLGQFAEELIRPRFLRGGVTNAHAQWDLHMNGLDIELGRHFYLSPSLLLRPFFGLKGFWSDQNFQVKQAGFYDVSQTISARSKIRFDDDGWGIGIRGGLQTSWNFTRNFSIFGNLALAIEWCRLHLKLKESGDLSSQNIPISLIDIKTHRYQMVPILELVLGLRWEMWFRQDRYHIALQWGWEEQMWWDFARSFDLFTRNSSGGNLNFQGLTLRARFDF